ncbi:MipA/OmpV family protein [Luteimonas sp. R10]|uniref:MipA/OmpV family protein n=1 Tax=Luteimonas sp. R10 TaxID=3108176 RepID=UPI003084F4A7|nr:MipA/OmpV family protein [Luteimonas sp. R10]
MTSLFTQVRRSRPVHRCLLAFGLALCAQQAAAQNYAGIGVAMVPEYEGAEDDRFLPLPLVRYETEHFFFSPRAGLPALGVKWSTDADLVGGLFLSAGMGRDADDAEILRGLEDLDTHAVYGAFLAWEPGRLSASVAYRRAAKSGYGATVDLRAGYRVLQRERDVVTLGANVEWADDDRMRTWFGITPEQAARSEAGLPVYAVSSGVKSVGASAVWLHRFAGSRWSLVTAAGVNRLQGDARDSPVVERATAPFASVGVVRAF